MLSTDMLINMQIMDMLTMDMPTMEQHIQRVINMELIINLLLLIKGLALTE